MSHVAAGPPTVPPPGTPRSGGGTARLVVLILGVVYLPPVALVYCTVTIVRTLRAGGRVARRIWNAAIASAILWTAPAVVLLAVTAAGPGDDGTAGRVAFTVVGSILSLLWVAPVIACGVAIQRARRATRVRAARVERRLFDRSAAGGRVERALETLATVAPRYGSHRIGGEPVVDKINRIVAETHELIRRLRAKGTRQQVLLAETQYADTLEKVVLCVSPDYLLDVIENRRLWHDPDERVAAVGRALDTVAEQIVDNIRQANAHADLDFQVALTTLSAITDDSEFAQLYQRGSR